MPAGKVKRPRVCPDYHMHCPSLHRLGFAMYRGWRERGRWVLQNHTRRYCLHQTLEQRVKVSATCSHLPMAISARVAYVSPVRQHATDAIQLRLPTLS